ncbi:LytTR family transcriptional regulator DNA-binding domain-containing protein [soil metagenome]
MPALRIVIADDEPLARGRFRQLLERAGDAEIVGEAENGHEAIAMIERELPDAAFLDIQMGALDGMRVLESLDDPPAVVFSTAFEHYAVRAFELGAVDYLLKPYSAERLKKSLNRIRRLLTPHTLPAPMASIRIPAQDGREVVLVPAVEILTVKIEEGVPFLLRIDGERLVCNGALAEVEDQLARGRFLRISRQTIVNLDAVQSWEPEADGGIRLRLHGGIEENVSRRRARYLKEGLKGGNGE